MANPINSSEFFDPLGPGAQDLLDYSKAIQSLSRNYKTFVKNLESDGERVKGLLNLLGTQTGELRQQVAGVNLLNEQERVGMAALAVEVAKLVREQERLKTVQEAQGNVQRRVKNATDEARLAYRAMQNELREAFKAGDTARIEKAALALRGARAETVSLSAALRGANSEFSAAKGSYDALDAENKKLIASLKALEGGIGSGSGEALRLQKQINANTETLKAFDEGILVFNRNVGNYKSGFSGLIAELAKARAAQAAMTQGTAEAARQQLVVSGFQTAAQKSAAQMGLSYEQANAKINGATAAVQPLATALVRLEQEQRELAKTTGEETEQYRKLGFQIQSTKKQLDDVAASTVQAETKQGGFSQQLGFTKEGLKQYATQLAVGAVGLQALAQGIRAVFTENVDYARSLAEVRKTTGLTAAEAERLAQSLEALNSTTSLAGLLKIASVGGQLGVAKNDLLGFTKAIDVAVQALGNDFTGGAEEIATVLGKLGSVYRRELGPDQAQNILAIGSAINQISADGAATAPFLTDVALRIGAIAASSRLGIDNALAYAAVLQEQGFAAEVSGTALNRLFSTLSTKTKQAYEIAKLANPALTLKDFTRLVNTDFNQAIQLFLKGLNEGGKSTTEQARLLATLKLQSGEAKSAIVTLAQNTALFAERQQTANTQLREATSLSAEAAVNIDNLAGSTDLLKNEAGELVTSGALGGILKFLVDVTRFNFKAIREGFGLIGDGFVYLADKAGLVEKPLVNYTDKTVASALATIKQVTAQEQLLNSYTALRDNTARTAAQEVEYSTLRQKLVQEYGTAETKVILDSIARRKEQVENTKNTLRQEIATFTSGVDEAQAKFALAQDAISVQLAGKTAEQLAAIRAVAKARADNPELAARTSGRSLYTEAEIKAATRLNQAEQSLKDQQLLRAQAMAALAKLEPAATQAKLDGADAADTEAKAEEELDRAAQQRAKNRVDALRDELADNQERLKQLRDYQAEQGKLFEDKQITPELFAERVRGSEDLATQIQRDGAAIRVKIVRAEAAERLQEADNDRIRQSNKKNVSQAELNDIQQQYALRAVEIERKKNREIAQVQKDLQKVLREDPLEFKLVGIDPAALKKADDAIDNFSANQDRAYARALDAVEGSARAEMTAVTQQYANGKISRNKYEDELFAIRGRAIDKTLKLRDEFHRAENQQDLDRANQAAEAAERLAARRIAIIEKAAFYEQAISGAYFAIKGNLLDADIQRENEAYEQQIKVAGDNAALKTQIEEKHNKELKRLNYEKAKAERQQALYSIAINTAVAVAKDLATYGFLGSIPFVLGDLLLGGLQAAVVLSKPLPAYFKGRAGGPAEFAQLGERGPELVGQPGSLRLIEKPSVGYLAPGDRVYTAPETSQILAQNELVEGRLVQRQYQRDLDTQTSQLRTGALQREAAQQRAVQQSNDQVLAELRQVRKAIQEQEYYRLDENDDLVRRSHQENGYFDMVNKRYKRQ